MKKSLLIFVLLFAAGIAFGQFSIGPKIGYNTSKLTTDLDQVSSDMTNNFHFGVFARFGQKFYLQPEINWLTQGSVFKRPALNDLSPVDQEITMKTIEIPVIVGLRLLNFGMGNVRVLVGPSASIVTDKTVTTTETSGYINPIKESDLQDMIWGFNVGAGVDILMFTLDIRYQMGLNEVIEKVQNFDMNSKTNMFAVSLGWKIL